MKQLELESDWYLLPKERSRETLSKAIFTKKELTDKQKSWLKSHDESNWLDIVLTQDYTNAKKIKKKLVWKLPGTKLKKETCGLWVTKGCDNVWGHPENKKFVKHSKRSCFRSCCEYCWLEKWLSRESHRATQRIENYIDVFKNLQFARNPNVYKISKKGKPTKTILVPSMQRKYLKPIHVVVSPPWKDKFMSFDKLKEKARRLINEAGIEGGLMIYHPFSLNKKLGQWIVRPHFHVVGFGWVVNTVKISSSDKWVIKNKGLRNSLHSTIYYQLSHAGVSDDVHSLTWFGSLGYRAKYADRFKVEEDDETDFCDYCGIMLVEFEYVGLDRPPDYEFVGLVDGKDWRAKETLEEAVKKKELRKNRYRNPRKGYVDNGQGIGEIYSRWLEKKLFVFPFQIIS
ncbi:MAG: hypothetical protein IIB80_00675 [Thaumarchaeota archaeon]|nr:hypothetical protein [Nitrososphaerota archaeon]